MKNKKKQAKKPGFFEKLKKYDQEDRRKSRQGGKLEKTTLNKRLLIVLIIFLAAFLLLVVYLVYFQLFRADEVVKNDHNQRLRVDENKVVRGSIFDRNGEPIVTTEKDDNGNNYSYFHYGEVDSAFTGYNSTQYGKTGLEKTYNNILLNINKGPASNLKKMAIQTDHGYNLNLTIDQTIQNLAYQYLKNHIGAIVIMNPKTGNILAMDSNPTFNPNSIEKDRENLVQNNEGPLLNRACMGVYRPGSTMKIITTTAILESGIDEYYNDTGEYKVQGYDVKNFDNEIFGNLDLRTAFLYSVNTYFADKTVELGKDKYKETAEKYMFNKDYKFDLEANKAKIPFEDLNKADFAMTGFGYGKTQVSPLHMCLAASTIANDGVMMAPKLVASVSDENGKIKEKKDDQVLSEVTSKDIAQKIRDYMVATVNEGTGKKAGLSSIQIAGKTGTADRQDGSTDARFVGFAPAYDPKIAISVVLENDGSTGGDSAAPLAGNLIQDIFNNVSF